MKSIDGMQQIGRIGRALLIAIVVALVPAVPIALAAGPTCTVAASGGTYTTIQAAVNDSGCITINVAAGTYTENVTIDHSVTITGSATGSTIVDGNNAGNVFTITGSDFPTPFITFNRLTIQHGSSGIFINGPGMTVLNSTIRNNTDSGISSSISNFSVVNSTIANNTSSIGVGGGITVSYASATITASTIAGNSISRPGQYGQGEVLMAGNGSITLRNTIVARGCATRYDGAFVDGGHNLDGAGGCNVGAVTDPRLDTKGVQNNGGPTPTIALLAGSPAIDAGDDAICAAAPVSGVDQRGITRPHGAHCDIGAYESDTVAPPIVTTSFTPDGQNGWFITKPATGSVTAEGFVGITDITCSNATVSNKMGLGTTSAHATVSVTSEGSTYVTCRAVDSVGQVGVTAGVFVRVDTVAPTTTITEQPTNPTSSSTARFSFSSGNSDNSGLAAYECALDGMVFVTCTSPQTYSKLDVGQHTFQVRATDNAGNVEAPPASSTWTIVAPTATATNTPLPTSTNTPVPPTATATDTPLPTATATNTPLPTSTNTPVPPTATDTPLPTSTNTPVPPTATATNTPLPTSTNTPVPPTNGVLDLFNRANGSVGANWEGLTGTSFYKITSNQLTVGIGGPLVWKPTSFGTSQEAFVTLATIDPKGPAQGVLLKVQTGSIPNAGAISVTYDAIAKAVRVSTIRLGSNGAWTLYAAKAATFANGDVLKARVLTNGSVQIFKNGTLITTVTLTSTDHYFFDTKGGKIGVWAGLAPKAILDDFGGGSVTP